MRELVARRRSEPGDERREQIVAAHEEGDRLTEDELTSAGYLLLAAGHATTVNLIANGVYALLTHPDQLALLQERPDLLPAAIEELLRHDDPRGRRPPRLHAARPVPQLRLAAPPDTLVRTPGLLMNGFAALPVLLGGPHVR